MAIIFDILVIAIIALFTFLGYRQGLVKAAIKILSFFIAIIVSLTIYKPVSGMIIDNTSIDDNIKNVIVQKMGAQEFNEDEQTQVEENLTDKIVGEVNNKIVDVANETSIKIIEVATLLLIFILIKIALKFVTILTDLITKLPLIKQVNKLRWNYIWINKGNNYSLCDISSCLFSIANVKTRAIGKYR